jgi:hypothetical protein
MSTQQKQPELQPNGQRILVWIDLAAGELNNAVQRQIAKTENKDAQSAITRDALTFKELLYKALPSSTPQPQKQSPISFVDRPLVLSWLIMTLREIEAAADSLILQSNDSSEQFLITADFLAVKEKLHRMFVASNHFMK